MASGELEKNRKIRDFSIFIVLAVTCICICMVHSFIKTTANCICIVDVSIER